MYVWCVGEEGHVLRQFVRDVCVYVYGLRERCGEDGHVMLGGWV